jgi:formiminotetrahydrofolate cyclodeaminase
MRKDYGLRKHLMTAPSTNLTVAAWLDALASDAPAPGGGAAAALSGALAAALVSMVARFTIDRPKFAAVQNDITLALEQSEDVRARLLALVDVDATAYHAVAAAYRLPRDDKAARVAAIQLALVQATEAPLQVAEAARCVVDLAHSVAAIGNPTVITDAGGAALLAQAALHAALLNVDVNLATLRDEGQRARFAARRQAVVVGVDDAVAAISALIAGR